MGKEKREKKSIISRTGWITLFVGLASIASSLSIFYSLRSRPSLSIEQLPTITYVSSQALSELGEVVLTVNGEKVLNLHALPFSLRNTGNDPISSIENSQFFNLLGPIVIEFVPQFGNTSGSRIFAIQTPTTESTGVKTSYSNEENRALAKISLRNLNEGEQVNFTVLYTGKDEPEVKLLGNPLLGGILNLSSNTQFILKETFWYRLKSVWLAQALGFLFISQFPIVLIWLIVGARTLYKEMKQNMLIDFLEESPEKKEQKRKIEEKINEKLKILDNDTISYMQKLAVPIPIEIDMFEETVTNMSIYDIFIETYKEEWQWILEKEFPIEKEFDLDDRVISDWLDWGDYFRTAALPFGIITIILFIFGYTLLFLN